MRGHENDFDLKAPTHTPTRLLNEACFWLGAMSDAELAKLLEVHQSNLTRIRKRRQAISAHILVQIMDRTGWTIQKVRELAGIPFDGPPPPTEPRAIQAMQAKPAPKPQSKLVGIRPQRKLDDAAIHAIRIDRRSRKDIAKDYAITPQHVGLIKRRMVWRNLERI